MAYIGYDIPWWGGKKIYILPTFYSTTLWDINMTHDEIYNIVRAILGPVLLTTMFMTPSCEDDRLPEPQENIQMIVNGGEIVAS